MHDYSNIEFEAIVGIGDDFSLQSILSLCCGSPGRYLATLEPPRLKRIDGPNEIVERLNLIRMVRPRHVLLLNLGQEENERLRTAIEPEATCVELNSTSALLDFLDHSGYLRETRPNPHAAELIGHLKVPDDLAEFVERGLGVQAHPEANGIVCSEPAPSLMTLTALNYAWAFGFHFRALRELASMTYERVQRVLLEVDDAIENSPPRATALVSALERELETAIDRSLHWPDSVPLCFFTRGAPYGMLFRHNPTSHVIELEAGLNTAFSVGWMLHEAEQPPKPGYTALFVDPKWPDITSETDDILDAIRAKPFWIEELSGDRATCKSFELNASHFPYDVLYVSSHGGAPRYRWCRYEISDEEGNTHDLETHEFEYFSPVGMEHVEIMSKTYLLAIDGVPRVQCTGPMREWAWRKLTAGRRGDLMPAEFKWIENSRVEGIAFRDGVFFGPLWCLASMGHPLVVLNCCSMWPSIGVLVVHARSRACIATLWSVDDDDAVIYGRRLFNEALEHRIVNAHYTALSAMRRELSAKCYIALTWPHATMPKVERDFGIPLGEFVNDVLLENLELRVAHIKESPQPDLEIQICGFLLSRLQEVQLRLGIDNGRAHRTMNAAGRLRSAKRALDTG